MRLLLTTLLACMVLSVGSPVGATKKLPPHVVKQLLIRRSLGFAANATATRTKTGLKNSIQSTARKVNVKVVKPRTTKVQVKIVGAGGVSGASGASGQAERVKVIKRASGVRRVTVRRVRRLSSSSIALLRAALDGDAVPQRTNERIRPIRRVQPKVIVARPGGDAPSPSVLTKLKYQMDLLLMAEALR